ncbi:MAG: WecB/TagA/CpsF family glycosyltransferase [Armatimonadota bacterium]|nr:WecB/TagA/CpsF family glycosyltransferase [Armatimonadota bacterium]
MLTNDLLLLAVIFGGALALARVLRAALEGEQDHPPPHLDARGLLLYVPLVVFLAAGTSEDTLVPLMGAAAVYLLAMLRRALHTPRGLRVVLLLAAAAVVYYYGVSIETFRIPLTSVSYELGWLSLPLTAAWLVVCAVLFGRAGDIPRVSFGVAGLTGVTFYLICLMVPWAVGPAAKLLALSVAGVSMTQVFGFGEVSQKSAEPSSYAMGFLIGALAVVGALKHAAAIAALLPLLVISVPLFGATYTYISRLRGMRIGQRRQHLHEVLLEEGYSQQQVVGVLLGLSAYMCLLGLLMVRLIPQPPWVKATVLVAGLLIGPFVCFVILRMLGRPVERSAETVEVLNVRLHPLSMEEALKRAESFIRQGGSHMIVTSDTSAVVRAQSDEELRTIINEADLAMMDGQGVVLCARLLNFPASCRVPGVDMMERLCEIAARLHRPVALLGAAPGVASDAARVLEQRYPGLEVVYTHHGYFTPQEEPQIVADIRDARPAALFVAMGIPKQEKWIKRHMDELKVPVCMGVGGSLDVIAGRVKRAPLWMRRWGLEWLYRTALEPRRLPRLAALPKLFLMTLRKLLSSSKTEVPAGQADCGKGTK